MVFINIIFHRNESWKYHKTWHAKYLATKLMRNNYRAFSMSVPKIPGKNH